jgi:hypothetical protein
MADTSITRRAVSDFILELETARTKLAKQTLKRQRLELKKIQLDRQSVVYEANTMYNIATETDENGKAKYSNETMRKSRIEIVLSESKDYQKMLNTADTMKKRIYRFRCEEEITYATIKKLESLERLYFYDLESEVKAL